MLCLCSAERSDYFGTVVHDNIIAELHLLKNTQVLLFPLSNEILKTLEKEWQHCLELQKSEKGVKVFSDQGMRIVLYYSQYGAKIVIGEILLLGGYGFTVSSTLWARVHRGTPLTEAVEHVVQGVNSLISDFSMQRVDVGSLTEKIITAIDASPFETFVDLQTGKEISVQFDVKIVKHNENEFVENLILKKNNLTIGAATISIKKLKESKYTITIETGDFKATVQVNKLPFDIPGVFQNAVIKVPNDKIAELILKSNKQVLNSDPFEFSRWLGEQIARNTLLSLASASKEKVQLTPT